MQRQQLELERQQLELEQQLELAKIDNDEDIEYESEFQNDKGDQLNECASRSSNQRDASIKEWIENIQSKKWMTLTEIRYASLLNYYQL